VLQKTDTGGLFVCEDVALDQPRLEAREVVITGPMFGEKMRAATGPAGEIEAEILAASGIDPELFRTWSRLGEGTRRPFALFPTEMSARRGDEHCSVVVEFVLPKGAYATSVLAEASRFRDASADATGPRPADSATDTTGEVSEVEASPADGSTDTD
jgi:tRNA pseudouridine13 synthase